MKIDAKKLLILNLPYDPAIIGQIVEKVIVYEGTRIELVMKNQDSYEAVFALTEQISA